MAQTLTPAQIVQRRACGQDHGVIGVVAQHGIDVAGGGELHVALHDLRWREGLRHGRCGGDGGQGDGCGGGFSEHLGSSSIDRRSLVRPAL